MRLQDLFDPFAEVELSKGSILKLDASYLLLLRRIHHVLQVEPKSQVSAAFHAIVPAAFDFDKGRALAAPEAD
jgi:hypothetical protein